LSALIEPISKRPKRSSLRAYSDEGQAYELSSFLAEDLKGLKEILDRGLDRNVIVDFNLFKMPWDFEQFQLPSAIAKPALKPQLQDFLAAIQEPEWWEKLFLGAARRWREAVSIANSKYDDAIRSWEFEERVRLRKVKEAEEEHERKSAEFQALKTLRRASAEEFEVEYLAGGPSAISQYCEIVLDFSPYPLGFPQKFQVAFSDQSRQLVVDYELPTISVVPTMSEFRIIREQIVEKARKSTEIKSIYQDIIAAVALRTIHELFAADSHGYIEVICFNGFIRTVDPANGQDIRPYLISVRATRQKFSQIDLRRVDKAICLKNLGAQVSRSPNEAQPVKPIVEFRMSDPRFVDQADLVSGLSAATNLMDLNPFEFEQLVANLFSQMGLDSKLTRSSRDGGVDCIAYDRRPVLGGKVVIQAKRYRNTVGVSAVRDLYGTMLNEGANKGILVSTSGYGPDAFEFAKAKPIELIDGGNLLYLLQEIGVEARIVFPED